MTEEDKALVERLRYLGAVDRLMGEPLFQAADRIEALAVKADIIRAKIMTGLWPVLGGNMLPAELWHEISAAVTEAFALGETQ